MASLTQCRALSGCRAFTAIRPRQAKQISNGCKVFMRRKDSYMVEVNIGEEETEDIAVRRFMKAVMESKVVEQLRARKTKESKIEAYKRRLRERHEIRKLGIVEPTWEEVNGDDITPKVFDEFFSMDPDGEFGLPIGQEDGFMMNGYGNDSMWGGYMDGQNRSNWDQGGYMDQTGGYMNQQPQQQQGGFPDQGGYINTPTAEAGQATYDSRGNFVYTAPQ